MAASRRSTRSSVSKPSTQATRASRSSRSVAKKRPASTKAARSKNGAAEPKNGTTKRKRPAVKKVGAKTAPQASKAAANGAVKGNRVVSAAAKSTRSFGGFSPNAVAFLVELKHNNDRDWFKANQDRYEAEVREPTLSFIRAVAPLLRKISPHMLASDKRVGGSMMRPQRDTRFSKDGTPYKTNVGVHFRNEAGKDVHAPGYYFHFDPESVFIGAGIWHPDAPALQKIRKHINDNAKQWSNVLGAKPFTGTFEPGGTTLSRPPKGYDATHPMIEVLKRKDHIAVANLTHAQLHRSNIVDEVCKHFATARPFMKLLHDALGLAF